MTGRQDGVLDRDEALQVLRREVAGREFEFATVLEVSDGGPGGFLLRVRSGQRLRPHTLVVAADERGLALDHSLGEPLPADDVQVWADGAVMWLMEQLDTGGLRWGRRTTLSDGTVAINPTLEPEPSSPCWISPVPLERPTRAGRAAHADGRLVQWLQLYLDDRIGSPPVAQLVGGLARQIRGRRASRASRVQADGPRRRCRGTGGRWCPCRGRCRWPRRRVPVRRRGEPSGWPALAVRRRCPAPARLRRSVATLGRSQASPRLPQQVAITGACH